MVRYTLCGWARFTSPEVQPALGLEAIFPHPSDSVADSTCPRAKVMLLARAVCSSGVVSPLPELSHPAALSHQETLAQTAAGSEMGNLRRQLRAAAHSRPAQHLFPHCSYVLLLLLDLTCSSVSSHLSVPLALPFFVLFAIALGQARRSFSNCELFKHSLSNVNRPLAAAFQLGDWCVND